MQKTRIFTRGDDLGSSLSANKAIFNAYKFGVLRNTSLMACCPFVDDAIEYFKGEKGICIGLHATLNAEWDNFKWGPLTKLAEVAQLTDDSGMFFNNTQILYDRNIPVEVFLKEIQTQLDYATRKGFEIKYIDHHMNFLWAQEGLAEAVNEFRISKGLYPGTGFKSIPFKSDSEKEKDMLRAGDAESYGKAVIPRLADALKALTPGDYMIVGHPAYNNEEMRQFGHQGYDGNMVAAGREVERRYFDDPQIVAVYKDKGIIPSRFDEM